MTTSGVHNVEREGVRLWSTHALIRFSFCLPELADILFLEHVAHGCHKKKEAESSYILEEGCGFMVQTSGENALQRHL